MKNILAALFLLVSLSYSAQNDAIAYMNTFSNEYSAIQQSMWDYTRTISHGKSARKVEKTRLELIKQSDNALSNAKKAKDFNGSTAFRDSVISYFTIVNLVLKEDYEKLVDMEEVAEQSYDLMEAYMTARDLASDKQTEAANMIGEEQRKFAEANGVTLIESTDDLGKKMEIASMVYEHYNAVYLIFFKSFKQELYLINSISGLDMSGIEQNKEALLSTLEEGRIKIKEVPLYQNDETMVASTRNLFDFYEEEAQGVALVQDYLLKTEKFNKVKTAFDEKKEKSRTQADVDQYNEAVNEMNAAITTYNEWNDKMNEKRSKFIDAWNSAAAKFTDKHVPKKK